MVSYAAGSRYLSLIGGVCMSFYDWYCDLPPSSPQTWGEQTDVPESADWYNASYIIAWGSNVPQTRTPDAHFFTEVRYKGTKTVGITPDYSEVAKLCDLWLHPKQGTDAALAMAMGHVILKEFHVERKTDYFDDYCRRYTDMPMLVKLVQQEGRWVPGPAGAGIGLPWRTRRDQQPRMEDRRLSTRSRARSSRRSEASAIDGVRRADGISKRRIRRAAATRLRLTLAGVEDGIIPVAFPYFGGKMHEHFRESPHDEVLERNVPVKTLRLADGEHRVATVFDLMIANYGVDRGFGGANVARSYDEDVPYTPAWQERITGVGREQVITVAREFAETAEKTKGRSMVIIGAAMNHWYHSDMNYRGVINMLVMCGCVGQSGGGWAHYVGQEKLRPQTGWTPLAFALDWVRPPRQMNSTSFFYAHTDQCRYERVKVADILSPLAPREHYTGSLIDFNVRAERMGGSRPRRSSKRTRSRSRKPPRRRNGREGLRRRELKSGRLKMSCEDPDKEANFPRNLFVWRSNLLGSSGKGHEYFMKYLLGTQHGIKGKDLGEEAGAAKPEEVVWHERAPEGKLDLLVTLDFRMSTTCLYSDIVLPTATWYEKNDLNTSDMHPFIHPLTAAVDPVWQSRSDWEIYKGFAKKFSELVPGYLGVEKDLVLAPTMHDTAGELAQALDVKDWKKGECEAVPGKTMPGMIVVERDYPNTYKRFTALGPLMVKIGNGGKGIAWNTEHEVESLRKLNYPVTEEGATKGLPRIESDVDATEVVLTLAPETNGEVAVKAWKSLSEFTGRDHTHLAAHARGREAALPRSGCPAPQDHLVADVERSRVGARVL